jgi:hypothetical protein
VPRTVSRPAGAPRMPELMGQNRTCFACIDFARAHIIRGISGMSGAWASLLAVFIRVFPGLVFVRVYPMFFRGSCLPVLIRVLPWLVFARVYPCSSVARVCPCLSVFFRGSCLPCLSVFFRGSCLPVFIRVLPWLVFARVYPCSSVARFCPCLSVARVCPWLALFRGLEGLTDAEVETAPFFAGSWVEDETVVGAQEHPRRSQPNADAG